MSTIHIHIHDIDLDKIFNWLDRRGGQLSHMEAMLASLIEKQGTEMALLDDLKDDMDATTAAISRNSDVVESGKQAILALVQQVQDMGANANDLQTLKSTIEGWSQMVTKNSDNLAAAIPAPTP